MQSGDHRGKVGVLGVERHILGMPLLPLVGHDAIRRRLAESIHRQRLPGSVLLVGPSGVGKQRLGLWLGAMRLCDRVPAEGLFDPCGACAQCRYTQKVAHPDLHWYFPRPRLKDNDASAQEITSDLGDAVAERVDGGGVWAPPSGTEGLYVATVRALVQRATLRPALARHSVFVVGECDRMVPQEGADQAANAFLKLLEEPPAHVTLVLTSSESGALLPTIRSRVVQIRVPPLTRAEVQKFAQLDGVRGKLKGMTAGDAVLSARGAPGTLFAAEVATAARAAARGLLSAALDTTPAGAEARIKGASRQGVAGARGAFSDTLDALTDLLHHHTHDLVTRGDLMRARRAAGLFPIIEETKRRASGNVSPQLLASSVVRQIRDALA